MFSVTERFNTIINLAYWNDISIQFYTSTECYIQRYLLICNIFDKILMIYHLRSVFYIYKILIIYH